MRLTLDTGWEFTAVIDTCSILCSGAEVTAFGLGFLEARSSRDWEGRANIFFSSEIFEFLLRE